MKKKKPKPKLSFSEAMSQLMAKMERLFLQKIPNSDFSGPEFGQECLSWLNMLIEKPETEESISEIPIQEQTISFEDTLLGQYILNDTSANLERALRVEKALINSLESWAESDKDKLREALIALLEIAEWWRNSGDTDRSNDLIEQVNGWCREYLEPTDPLMVSALIDAAEHFFQRGNLDGAESLLKRVLDLSEMNPVGTETYKTRALINLGAVMCARSRFPLALGFLDEALTWTEQQKKPDKSHILEILSNQTRMHLAMERKEDFDRVAKKALKACKKYWSSIPQDSQDCLMTLFGLYQMQNRFDEARFISKTLMEMKK